MHDNKRRSGSRKLATRFRFRGRCVINAYADVSVPSRLRSAGQPAIANAVAPAALDDARADDLALPLERVGERHVVLATRRLHVAYVITLRTQEGLGEGIEDVDTVHLLTLADGDLERHHLVVVGLRQLEWLFQLIHELAEPLQRNVLKSPSRRTSPRSRNTCRSRPA